MLHVIALSNFAVILQLIAYRPYLFRFHNRV